jgi:hypothetical protein
LHDIDAHDVAYLFAFAPLEDVLRFMATEAIDPPDPSELIERWRAAHDQLARLQQPETDWVEQSPFAAARAGRSEPRVEPLPAEMAPLVPQVQADPIFQHAFSTAPTRIAMVELDRLIVYQRTIDLAHVKRLTEQLGSAPPASDELFRFCLPTGHAAPRFRVRPVPRDRGFVFVSESSDLRFLESTLLDPDQLREYRALGPIAGVVGLVVGFGSNFLNVIEIENRLILNNGNHRAFALRELGVTRAPCLVQQVNTRDDLKRVAGGRLRRRPENYLDAKHPPRLRDFFNPTFARRVRVMPKLKQVRVTFEIEEMNI